MRKARWVSLEFVIIFFIIFSGCSEQQWFQDYQIIKHELDIKIEPEKQLIFAKDKILFSLNHESNQFDLLLSSQFKVDSIFFKGKPTQFTRKEQIQLSQFSSDDTNRVRQKIGPVQAITIRINCPEPQLSLEIFYHGKLKSVAHNALKALKYIENQIVVALENSKAVLISAPVWYPTRLNSQAQYEVAVLTPNNFEAITTGALVSRALRDPENRLTVYRSDMPVKPISLFAGPYIFTPFIFGNVEMSAYFFPAQQQWAARYFEAATRYFDLYHREFGDYAYPKFSIVTTPLPCMQAFPSFSIIDSSRIHLIETSSTAFGHLVCRNWWGECVFTTPYTGDWSEGLATFLAEHLYQERVTADKASGVRYHFLRKYALEIPPNTKLNLLQTWNPANPVHNVINKTRGLMLFYQIRNTMGDEHFFKALAKLFSKVKFKSISWAEISAFFETEQETMKNVFQFSLTSRVVPQFSLQNTKFIKLRKGYQIQTEIKTQLNSDENNITLPFQIPFQLRLQSRRQSAEQTVPVDSVIQLVKFNSKSAPGKLMLDPDFHHFRQLNPEEIQPFIGQALNSHDKLFVLPGKIKEELLIAYRRQIRQFHAFNEKVEIKFDYQVTADDLKTKTLILFGGILQNRITAKIHPNLPSDVELEYDCFVYNKIKYWKPKHALIASVKNPYNAAKTILIYWGISRRSILRSAREVFGLQDYGFAIFRDGIKATWRQWHVDVSPLIYKPPVKQRARYRRRRSSR